MRLPPIKLKLLQKPAVTLFALLFCIRAFYAWHRGYGVRYVAAGLFNWNFHLISCAYQFAANELIQTGPLSEYI